MNNTRKEMPSNEVFNVAFNYCVDKNGKAIFTDSKNAVKQNYPSTVIASTVDKNGKKINTHKPYKNEVAEIQVINSERKPSLNKDKYIEKLESEVSAKKCELYKAQCMEEQEGSITVNVKPTKEFEVEFNKQYVAMLDKLAQKLAKQFGLESELEQVRQKALQMVKGKQAN